MSESVRVHRVLLLQVALPAAAEYSVHRTLAENVDGRRVAPFFVWQRHTRTPENDRPARLDGDDRNLFLDFGRDLTIPAYPPRVGRSLLMARRLPGAIRSLTAHFRAVRPDLIYTSQQTFDVYLARWLARRFAASR